MPLIMPPSVAYQSPLIPIAGRWNKKPPEGDKFVACEIDWGVTVPIGQAVQFSLNAGPVEFSQIIAFSVDNGRSGSAVSFVFPDTGRQLTVPSFSQGVYPVFTSALSFYVIADTDSVGDITEFEILNSMPPPVSVLPAQAQTHANLTGVNIAPNGTTPVVAAGINGTLQGFSLTIFVPAAATGFNAISLSDGAGHQLWTSFVNGTTSAQSIPIQAGGLSLRFVNGLNFVVSSSTLSAGNTVINVYYSIP